MTQTIEKPRAEDSAGTLKPEAGLRPIIATRKTCDAEGTGLSHYVLMDKQVTR